MKKPTKHTSKLAAIIRSRGFFVVVLVFFVFESVWIALSSRYPMAFDENTHLGIIKLYAQQWSPFMTQQPSGLATFGPLTRDPSYLYHWLLSFPYRWLNGWLHSQMDVVIWLRLLNVAFFAGGLVLFRKVLLRTKASAEIVHTALLFFVLIPIVPLLAGQINYDNLLFLLLGWNLLLVLRFREQLLKRKRCNVGLLLVIVSLALLASLVQFAYLPILTAIVAYVVFLLWKAGTPRKLWRACLKDWRTIGKLRKIGLCLLAVVGIGLFVQMYGINLVKYHDLTPQCDQVLNVQRCQAYGPWARNYADAQKAHGAGNPLVFVGGWLWGMLDRSFFAINGPSGAAPYANALPPPLLLGTAVLVFGFGLFLLLRRFRAVIGGDPVLSILLFIAGVYLVALLGRNYNDYRHLGQLVAINGRYLIFIILPMFVAIGTAYERYMVQRWRAWLLAIVFILFMQGGGFISFIYFSDASWYWPNSQLVLHINRSAQHIVHPLILNWPKGIQ